MEVAILIALGAAALLLLRGIRIVPETQRLVVLRSGKVHSVRKPGLRWVLPGVDRLIRVDLDRQIANWQSLPEPELQAQLRQLVLGGRLPTAI